MLTALCWYNQRQIWVATTLIGVLAVRPISFFTGEGNEYCPLDLEL